MLLFPLPPMNRLPQKMSNSFAFIDIFSLLLYWVLGGKPRVRAEMFFLFFSYFLVGEKIFNIITFIKYTIKNHVMMANLLSLKTGNTGEKQ